MTEADYALGLGSNLGDGAQALNQAIKALEQAGLRLVSRSPFYTSPAWGYEDQPPFTNACILIKSTKPPLSLLNELKNIEILMGRKPSWRWGPRLIDIDILWWCHGSYTNEQLTIPHPSLSERAFVVVPLADIAPDLIIDGITLENRARTIDRTGLSLQNQR